MKNTVSTDVRWILIFIGACLLAASLTVVKKSGVRGPLSLAIFLVCEGALAFPILTYFMAETKKMNPWGGAVFGCAVCVIVFAVIRNWQPSLSAYYEEKYGQNVDLIWTQRAAILGFGGMCLFLTEIARLTSPREGLILQEGLMAAGIASTGLVLLEFLALIFCNYVFDFQWKGIVPFNERLASWQYVGVLMVTGGLILVAIMKDYKPYMERYADEQIARAIKTAEVHSKRAEVSDTHDLLITDDDESPQFGK